MMLCSALSRRSVYAALSPALRRASFILLLLVSIVATCSTTWAQVRDIRAERIVIDDNGTDGTQNTMTIQTPSPLGQNVVLVIPDMGSDTAQFLMVPSGSAGAWLLGGSAGTTPGTHYLGTSDSTALHLYVNGGPYYHPLLGTLAGGNSLILNTNGSIQRDDGGEDRGFGAVDMQIERETSSEVASGQYSVIGGGSRNQIGGEGGVIGGGDANRNDMRYGTISGGSRNILIGSDRHSTISGGTRNEVDGESSVVGGGSFNKILTANAATISGGTSNAVSADRSNVGGGNRNVVAGEYSAIGGGFNNRVEGLFSAIVGGNSLRLMGKGSFGFHVADTGTAHGVRPMTISEENTSVFGNTDLWLANNDGAASRLRFYESNSDTGAFPTGTTFYTSFEAGDQSEDINYILPTVGPSANGQVLSSDTSGAMSWVEPFDGWSLMGNAGTTPGTHYLGTSDSTALHLYVNGGPYYHPLLGTLAGGNSLILNTNGSIQRDDGGEGRGFGAVDMQIERETSSEVASGQYSVIGGGSRNQIGGEGGVIGGGDANRNDMRYGTISGGSRNILTGSDRHSTISGGTRNEVDGESSVVGGGSFNKILTANAATISGGTSNEVSADRGNVGGGNRNVVAGEYSAIGGGFNNRVEGLFSAIVGGNSLRLVGKGSFGFHVADTGTAHGVRPMTISEENTSVFGNTDLWLANNDGAASRLRFYESNSDTGAFPTGTTFYTSFEAGDQSEDINYILPTDAPTTNGQVLATTTAGVMSWVNPAASVDAWNLSGNLGTTPGTDYVGTSDSAALHLYVNGGGLNSMILNTNGSLQRGASGKERGVGAVDMQIDRVNSPEVASGRYSVIGGGRRNLSVGDGAVVGGGDFNRNDVQYGTISGGSRNILTGSDLHGTIGGGTRNEVDGQSSVVGGGSFNKILTAKAATISGGTSNEVSADRGNVAGGNRNVVAGEYSAIGGGFNNRVEGLFSAIVGGNSLRLVGKGSFGFHVADTGTAHGVRPMTISEENTSVFGNTDLWLANNDGAASRLRFYESNSDTGAFPTGTTFYTSFEAGDQSEDINYILPTVGPSTNGLVLSSDTSGVMSWVNPAASVNAWNLSGNIGTTPGTDYVGTADGNALHLYVNGGTDNGLILNTNGSLQRANAGNARGVGAVDMQYERDSNNASVAQGAYSTLSGGFANRAAGDWSTVGGGRNNTASSPNSTIGGGQNNVASNQSSTVGGGANNTASDNYTTVAGGHNNTALDLSATVGGGQDNTASDAYAFVGGGRENIASSTYTTVSGGIKNRASGVITVVGGGAENRASGEYSTIGGGHNNRASTYYSTVGGGQFNEAKGWFSTIPGGRGLILTGKGSFGFLGGNSSFGLVQNGNTMTVAEDNTVVFGNTDLWLANNDGAASKLRFYEANSDSANFPNTFSGTVFYTSFEAGDLDTNLTYILPTAMPTSNGQVLSADTAGVMSWVAGPTGAQSFADTSSATPTLELQSNATADDGVALEISHGSVVLANAQGAPTNIPDDISVYDIDDATASTTPTVGLPASGANGKILYIYVSDPDGATVGGVARASGDKLTYIYIGGGWQLFGVN